jgi:hypothetical protein
VNRIMSMMAGHPGAGKRACIPSAKVPLSDLRVNQVELVNRLVLGGPTLAEDPLGSDMCILPNTVEIYVILESPNLVYALPPWRRLQVSGHLLAGIGDTSALCFYRTL